jgi:hypothetical protein
VEFFELFFTALNVFVYNAKIGDFTLLIDLRHNFGVG